MNNKNFYKIMRPWVILLIVLMAVMISIIFFGNKNNEQTEPITITPAPTVVPIAMAAPTVSFLPTVEPFTTLAPVNVTLGFRHTLLINEISQMEYHLTTLLATPTPIPTPTLAPTPTPTPRIKTIRAEITAYCACKKCNSDYSDGHTTKTASGIYLSNEPEYADKYCAATAAVGNFGDIVIIDGIDYEIVDRMGRKDGKAIDIFVPDHKTCYEEYGRRRNYEVEVIKK